MDTHIAGDGIDEQMCGYYEHQLKPTEETYWKYMRKLQIKQLLPLDRNSGQVAVLLPYIDPRLVFLLAQIPIADKVDSNNRKKIMLELTKGKLPEEVINRRKFGFCSAFDNVTQYPILI